MNRRDFLRLLGLAPLVPLAAKLKPFLPKEEARCDTFMGFRFVRTELLPSVHLGKLRKEYGFVEKPMLWVDDRDGTIQGIILQDPENFDVLTEPGAWALKLPKNYVSAFEETWEKAFNQAIERQRFKA